MAKKNKIIIDDNVTSTKYNRNTNLSNMSMRIFLKYFIYPKRNVLRYSFKDDINKILECKNQPKKYDEPKTMLCSKCNKEKYLDCFYLFRVDTMSRSTICKNCYTAYNFSYKCDINRYKDKKIVYKNIMFSHCCVCNVVKEIRFFNYNKELLTGHQYVCTSCIAITKKYYDIFNFI